MKYLSYLLANKSGISVATTTVVANATADGATPIMANSSYLVTSTHAEYYVSLPETSIIGSKIILDASITAINDCGYRLEAGNDNTVRAANSINGASGASNYLSIPPSSIVIAEAISATEWKVLVTDKLSNKIKESVTATVDGSTTGGITNGEIITVTSTDPSYIVTLPLAEVGKKLFLQIANYGCVIDGNGIETIGVGTVKAVSLPSNSVAIFECNDAGQWDYIITKATVDATSQLITATVLGDGTGIITTGDIAVITSANDAHIVTLPAATVGRCIYLEIPTGINDAVITCAGSDKMGCGGVFTKLTMGQLTTALIWCTKNSQWNVLYSNDITPLS
jgi:hypothetical protein